MLDCIEYSLKQAEEAAADTSLGIGRAPERAREFLDNAQLLLLQVADDDELAGLGWEVLAMARQHLGMRDPRRIKLERTLIKLDRRDLTANDRATAVATLRAAQAASATEQNQARSFHLALRTTFWILFVIAAGLAVFCATNPHVMQVCFHRDESLNPNMVHVLVCAGSESAPNPYDVVVIESIGLAAAAFTSSLVLRRLDGTATAYTIPLSLALVKLPAGAISAVLGVILLGAGVVPGIREIVTREEVYAWAAIFGASQQTVTRLIDAKGKEVLDNIRGAEAKPDEEAMAE